MENRVPTRTYYADSSTMKQTGIHNGDIFFMMTNSFSSLAKFGSSRCVEIDFYLSFKAARFSSQRQRVHRLVRGHDALYGR